MVDTDLSTAGTSDRARKPEDAVLRVLLVLVALGIGAKIVLLAAAATRTFFVMDEFQQGGFSRYLAKGLYDEVWPFKTVLSAYFYLPAHRLAQSAVGILLLARLQTLGLAVLTVGALFGIARSAGRRKLEIVLAICTLLSFSTFMERSYRLRSEPLMVLCAMVAIWLVAGSRPGGKRLFAAGIFSGLAFAATQKAALLANLPLGLALVVDRLLERRPVGALARGALLLAGWSATLLAYGLLLGGPRCWEVIEHVLLEPLWLARHGGQIYPDLSRYLVQTLLRNPLAYSLAALGWLAAAPSVLRAGGGERRLWITTGVTALLVFGYSQPWPYVFVLALPLLGLWVGSAVPKRLDPVLRDRVLLALGLALLVSSMPRNLRYLGNGHGLQTLTVSRAESLLGVDETYMDGIGMVVNRDAALPAWWDRHRIDEIRADPSLLDPVLEAGPKLWILTYRTRALARDLAPRLRGSYLPVYPNILLAGALLDVGETSLFRVAWPGTYRLYDLRGKPVTGTVAVDGVVVPPSFQLERGEYEVVLTEGPASACLLPEGVAVELQIPPPELQRPLFPSVYSR